MFDDNDYYYFEMNLFLN